MNRHKTYFERARGAVLALLGVLEKRAKKPADRDGVKRLIDAVEGVV